MTVAKQLYQLQEVDLEIESNEQALNQIASNLGESQAVIKTQAKLKLEQQHLEELKREQHSAEWEIDDIITKLTTAEKKLYSGKIKNPKELTNLQHEIDGLKTNCDRLENKALELMDQVELTEAGEANLSRQLKRLKAEWRGEQQQLSDKMKQIKTMLSELEHKRQLLLANTDTEAVEFYHELKKQKGKAVAKVEQGICLGCRISLPITELKQARSGSLVQCSSCGRILFLA
jgi:predicted  nucleic acid-binding Zn-ribbon protein